MIGGNHDPDSKFPKTYMINLLFVSQSAKSAIKKVKTFCLG